MDPSTGTASAGFRLNSVDIYDQSLATENDSGGLTVGDLSGQHMESVGLPVSPMRGVEAAAFSHDGRFLAYAGSARSSIWDLKTQKRVALMRPFRAVRFNDQNVMFAQYKDSQQKPGQNSQIDLKTGKVVEGAKYAIDQFQRGDVMVTFQPMEKSGETISNVILQIADTATGAQLWSKRFPHDVPDVSQSEDGPLLLQIGLSDNTASDEIKHANGKLLKASDWKSDWYSIGQLIEVVDSHTGEIRTILQVPERYGPAGDNSQLWSSLYGDYLVVHGPFNNSVIYRVSDGMRMGAFYGRPIAGDGKLGLIAATNHDQDVTILDAKTGKQLKQVTVDDFPREARFIAEKNSLLVLTATQRVYTIDLPAARQAEAVPTK
jgi:WD40 repeat protein